MSAGGEAPRSSLVSIVVAVVSTVLVSLQAKRVFEAATADKGHVEATSISPGKETPPPPPIDGILPLPLLNPAVKSMLDAGPDLRFLADPSLFWVLHDLRGQPRGRQAPLVGTLQGMAARRGMPLAAN